MLSSISLHHDFFVTSVTSFAPAEEELCQDGAAEGCDADALPRVLPHPGVGPLRSFAELLPDVVDLYLRLRVRILSLLRCHPPNTREVVVEQVYKGCGGSFKKRFWLNQSMVVKPPQSYTATITAARALAPEVTLFRLGLDKPLDYHVGQYVSLRFPGERRYHAFSIASSPAIKGEIEVIVKRVGDFTQKLCSLPVGSKLECMGPMGHFMDLLQGDVVMIAGGVGVTPFLGMLRWARDSRDRERHYWLFLSSRTREHVILEEELRALDQVENIHVILTLTREEPEGWDGELGRFDKERLLKHLGSFEGKEFYTCGPGKMVEAMVAMLVESGVADELIKRESWG